MKRWPLRQGGFRVHATSPIRSMLLMSVGVRKTERLLLHRLVRMRFLFLEFALLFVVVFAFAVHN